MAKIVFGAGTSHTPMLLASDETLQRFVETDRNIKHRDKEGRAVTCGDLLEKADPKLAHMVAPDHLVKRQNVARDAVKHLRTTISATKLDALIVVGDDQNESYREDCRPTFAIYYGETIRNSNTQHETYSHFPDWYIKNRAAFFEPEKPRDYPVHAGLATHLISALTEAEFDLAASKCLPEGEGEGHAMAYVHRHVLDAEKPVPVVPIFLNTYYEPNRPWPKRCYHFGQALKAAVETFPGNARVGILASGGLSHFLSTRSSTAPSSKRSPTRMQRSCRACHGASCTPAPQKSSTGWRSPARSKRSSSTGSNMSPAIARQQVPAPA